MTTYIDFAPQPNIPFQFNATLDDQQYVVLCTWNLYGQRYYVNVYDLQGNLIVAIAQVGSPLNYDIDLVGGYFTTSSMVFRVATQQFEISP